MRDEPVKRARTFEVLVLPHLDAAHNLARWLTQNGKDAEDIVQEAYLRAFKFYGTFRGGNSRAWLLTIVRNTCYTWLQQNKANNSMTSFDEEIHGTELDSPNPETILLENLNAQLLKDALGTLPVEFREVLVLRELEGYSYKEIAGVIDVPMGTVMSRLARARKQLEQALNGYMKKGS